MSASRKTRRAEVYAKCSGRCGYCGHPITIEAMQIDHIHPKVDGGSDELENLLPACRTCNNYKLFWSLDRFRAMIADQINLLRRNTMNFRMAERYGLTYSYPERIEFYFERQSSDNSGAGL